MPQIKLVLFENPPLFFLQYVGQDNQVDPGSDRLQGMDHQEVGRQGSGTNGQQRYVCTDFDILCYSNYHKKCLDKGLFCSRK